MKKNKWIIIISIVAALLLLAVPGWFWLRGDGGDAAAPGAASSAREEAGEQQPENAGETAIPDSDVTRGEEDLEEQQTDGVSSGQGGAELPVDVFGDEDDTTPAGDSGNTENNDGTGAGDTGTGDGNTGSDSNELPAIPIG